MLELLGTQAVLKNTGRHDDLRSKVTLAQAPTAGFPPLLVVVAFQVVAGSDARR